MLSLISSPFELTLAKLSKSRYSLFPELRRRCSGTGPNSKPSCEPKDHSPELLSCVRLAGGFISPLRERSQSSFSARRLQLSNIGNPGRSLVTCRAGIDNRIKDFSRVVTVRIESYLRNCSFRTCA
jgi:hypothetical protein